MTKPGGVAPDTNDDVSSASWGTWEELLLAFAVNRHGTAAWDSVASELQKRTSDPNLCLTAHHCRSKYLDLKRRFLLKNGDSDDKSNAEESVPFLEELRKLRVAELRREVQRYDLNIEYFARDFNAYHSLLRDLNVGDLGFDLVCLCRSLELKMKRMEEEREKREADLENKGEKKDSDSISVKVTTAAAELEKDQLSVNESTSTDPAAKLRTCEEYSEPAVAVRDEVRNDQTGQTPAELKPETDQKSDSCNGSSNSIDEPDRKVKKSEPPAEPESGSESGGREAEATKETSDVQSSACRSRKEQGSDKVRRGSTSGDEREKEDQSCAVKEFPAESQPLIDFLHTIKAPKLGSIFVRRLRSQETPKYQKLILQHIDLQTIETRLKEWWYSSSSTNFFRDLLLLVNNALVFFAKNSPEATAASEIRRLISKEISHKQKQISLQSMSFPTREEAEPLMLKPSLIVCRKRSSIAAKAIGKKKEQTQLLAEEKETEMKPCSDAEEPKTTKKRTRDQFPAASASASASTMKQQQGKGGSSEVKGDMKKSQSTSDSKKRGAANFLNRMNQGSSSNNNGVLLDALKNTPLTSGESDQKKNESGKSKGRQTKEKSSPRRRVGRPRKRGRAPPAPGKRGRDKGEGEGGGSKPAKKRSRKL